MESCTAEEEATGANERPGPSGLELDPPLKKEGLNRVTPCPSTPPPLPPPTAPPPGPFSPETPPFIAASKGLNMEMGAAEAVGTNHGGFEDSEALVEGGN